MRVKAVGRFMKVNNEGLVINRSNKGILVPAGLESSLLEWAHEGHACLAEMRDRLTR